MSTPTTPTRARSRSRAHGRPRRTVLLAQYRYDRRALRLAQLDLQRLDHAPERAVLRPGQHRRRVAGWQRGPHSGLPHLESAGDAHDSAVEADRYHNRHQQPVRQALLHAYDGQQCRAWSARRAWCISRRVPASDADAGPARWKMPDTKPKASPESASSLFICSAGSAGVVAAALVRHGIRGATVAPAEAAQ